MAIPSSNFDEQDRRFMSLALQEAERASNSGNYPVGALLVVDGALVGQAGNSILTEAQSAAHAEQKLLSAHSAQLRSLVRDGQAHQIHLYSTLEPCLMCLGIAVLHRVKRIVVACPDPHGGATNVNPQELGRFYQDHWPVIEIGLMQEASADLIVTFLKTEKFLSWEVMLEEFTRMKADWEPT